MLNHKWGARRKPSYLTTFFPWSEGETLHRVGGKGRALLSQVSCMAEEYFSFPPPTPRLPQGFKLKVKNKEENVWRKKRKKTPPPPPRQTLISGSFAAGHVLPGRSAPGGTGGGLRGGAERLRAPRRGGGGGYAGGRRRGIFPPARRGGGGGGVWRGDCRARSPRVSAWRWERGRGAYFMPARRGEIPAKEKLKPRGFNAFFFLVILKERK